MCIEILRSTAFIMAEIQGGDTLASTVDDAMESFDHLRTLEPNYSLPRSNNRRVRSHKIVPLILSDLIRSDGNRTKNRRL